MPIERRCPNCSRDYPETATLCIVPACNNLDPPAPAALVPGTILPAVSDEYTITRVLGWGGMASTYQATNRSGDLRAVKEMLRSGNPKTQNKLEFLFEREARIQERLGHQLVTNPPIFAPFPIGEGSFRAHNLLFMAMQFMAGEDLDKIQDRVGAMPFLQVLQYGIEVCMILRDYLHGYSEMGITKPIIHRDIKPANLHVLRTTNTVCLLDFGIARFESFSAATMGRGGTRAGSPAFAMPEQLTRGKQISAFTDLGSLSWTIWALIANAKEFPDNRPDQIQAIRTFVREVELQGILIKGTDENTAGRYQSAEDLRLELVRVYELHQPLPVHLRPVVVPAAAAPAAIPAAVVPAVQPAAGRYKIVWGKTPTVGMPNGIEYQRDLMGKVLQLHRFKRNQPVPQVNVVVADIVDSGGGHPSGVSRVLTDATGYFHLDQIDTRVPVTVVERRLRIVVEETTGRPIHDETVRIKRPSQIGKRISGAVSSRYQQMKQGAQQWAGNRRSNRLTNVSSAKLFVAVAMILVAVTFVLAFIQRLGGGWLIYIWIHTIIGAIFAAFLAFRMRKRGFLTTKQRTFLEALKSPILIGGATLWVAATLIYWFP